MCLSFLSCLSMSVTLGLLVANWANEGCSYYPSICHLKDEIALLTPHVENISKTLNSDADMLKVMYEMNREFYNTLTTANGKNELIVGKLEMIRQYSADIVVLQENVAGVEMTDIDPEQIKSNVTAININIAGVKVQISSLKGSYIQMHKYWYIYGAFLAIEILIKILNFMNNAYNCYKSRKRMKNSQSEAHHATDGKIRKMHMYLYAHPRVAKVLKFAAYGVGFFLNGMVIYFDITTSKASHDSLMTIREYLRNIISDTALNQQTLTNCITIETKAATEMEVIYGKIRQGFVNSSDFMNQVKVYSEDYYDQSIARIPVYTLDNVNKNNLIACQIQYIDWLIAQEGNLQGFIDRMNALESVINMVNLVTPPIFAFQLLLIGQAHDPTVMLPIIFHVIIDLKPDLDLWPDMNMTTYQIIQHNLTQWRNKFTSNSI
ncbi:unnamed protein product [Owenia fusiformis]|uniref:Uncharacterized protein n=1 Tax=Owenia fusiformis TaxID=6347 RepID=A0A8S4NXV1_OWEFU|nr:unnamed protein product [Owenia fusiformis]